MTLAYETLREVTPLASVVLADNRHPVLWVAKSWVSLRRAGSHKKPALLNMTIKKKTRLSVNTDI